MYTCTGGEYSIRTKLCATCLQVAGGGEALFAHSALVRPLAGVHQMVFLEVRELRERLGAQLALYTPVSVGEHLNEQSALNRP